jgi:hypothetical protein
VSAGGDKPASDWSAAVDARLVARCEAHTRRGDRMVHEWSVGTRLRLPKLHLEPAEWGAGYLRADRERELPMQLSGDLRENMPQALLRDLYRPVYQERWIERETVEGTADRAGFGAMREAREARVKPPLPRVESGLGAVRAYQTWRRDLLAEHWKPVKNEPAK